MHEVTVKFEILVISLLQNTSGHSSAALSGLATIPGYSPGDPLTIGVKVLKSEMQMHTAAK